jgi:hypothetical protein
MAIFKKTVTAYRCEKCGYEWLPRFPGNPPPAVCPNGECKCPTWNRPRPKDRAKKSKRP